MNVIKQLHNLNDLIKQRQGKLVIKTWHFLFLTRPRIRPLMWFHPAPISSCMVQLSEHADYDIKCPIVCGISQSKRSRLSCSLPGQVFLALANLVPGSFQILLGYPRQDMRFDDMDPMKLIFQSVLCIYDNKHTIMKTDMHWLGLHTSCVATYEDRHAPSRQGCHFVKWSRWSESVVTDTCHACIFIADLDAYQYGCKKCNVTSTWMH